MSYELTPFSPMRLQNAVTAAAAPGGILLIRGECERVTVCIQGTGTLSSGNLVIEEAFYNTALLPDGSQTPEPPFAGTWSVIQTINALDVTGGAQQLVHIMGSIWALRVRCSVILAGGGSVSVFAWGN
jgi:hypothetical protein